jgi:hypothetical protein
MESNPVVPGGSLASKPTWSYTSWYPATSTFFVALLLHDPPQFCLRDSDYQSVEEAMQAIDRYCEERNEAFQKTPRRAGKKVWGKERVVAAFTESINCKDPRFMR